MSPIATAGPTAATSGSYTVCKRLLSRVPTQLAHIDRNLGLAVHQRCNQPIESG
jgi:hypothetical protein